MVLSFLKRPREEGTASVFPVMPERGKDKGSDHPLLWRVLWKKSFKGNQTTMGPLPGRGGHGGHSLCIPSARGVHNEAGVTLNIQHIPAPWEQRWAVNGKGLPVLSSTEDSLTPAVPPMHRFQNEVWALFKSSTAIITTYLELFNCRIPHV